jgi:hypothetical protein
MQSYSDPRSEFDRARFRAFWDEIKGVLLGQPTELMDFNKIKARLKLKQESYKGLFDVPLDRIAGSVGRYNDFTNKFLPRKRSTQERWERIYERFHSMEGLPPVELYQVDDVFFVRDGNHRVSVARKMGHHTIQAYVTELQTAVDLEPGMSERELQSATCYADFLEKTGLDRARPGLEPIVLTEPARYGDLLEHIHVTQQILGHRWVQETTYEEAARHWYDKVYLPAIKLIRSYEVVRHDPKRTEADLYIWLVEYLWHLRETYGEAGGEYKLSAALMQFLDERGIDIPQTLPWEGDKPIF